MFNWLIFVYGCSDDVNSVSEPVHATQVIDVFMGAHQIIYVSKPQIVLPKQTKNKLCIPRTSRVHEYIPGAG